MPPSPKKTSTPKKRSPSKQTKNQRRIKKVIKTAATVGTLAGAAASVISLLKQTGALDKIKESFNQKKEQEQQISNVLTTRLVLPPPPPYQAVPQPMQLQSIPIQPMPGSFPELTPIQPQPQPQPQPVQVPQSVSGSFPESVQSPILTPQNVTIKPKQTFSILRNALL